VSSLWPLFDHYPWLEELPRVSLRTAPTPVERIAERLWIKRDDLTAEPVGGNKVRALEFLLAQYPRGSRVLTGGSRGSTHVLATAVHGRALGLDVLAASWPQEMNDVARAVDARLEREVERVHFRSPVTAAAWLTWNAWRGRQVIPAGGTTPLGILGSVNAALELAAQVDAGQLPEPRRVVVPLGTGGTAAGLSLGFAVAGLKTMVVGARVVPRIVARRSRLRRLVRSTVRGIERDQAELSFRGEASVEIVNGVYGGAYGRPLNGAPAVARDGIPLDATYSAKAYVAALESARTADTLFWLTFDSRWITSRKQDDA
jgi:D-cysteine desulfhydrase